jgi:hypothetical protein
VIVAVAAALVLLAAACGSDYGTSSGDSAHSVSITSPANGAQVGESFDVHLALNFPIGDPDTGRDHVHLYYDGNTTEGEYGIAYSDTFTVTGLSPGMHTIQAVIAHADHSATSTRSEPITVEVSDGQPSSGGAGGTPSTGGGALGY